MVGVLVLVDQEVPVPCLELEPDGLVLSEEPQGLGEQVVEVEPAKLAEPKPAKPKPAK